MIATKTQPVQLDLGVTVLEESLWYLPNNSEGTVLGMDIMRKYGFVIHCFEKQIELKTEKNSKKVPTKKNNERYVHIHPRSYSTDGKQTR